MVNSVLARKLARDLWARKWSFAALAAMVAVGVAVFLSMVTVYRDLDGARERYYARYGLADFAVNLKRAPESTLETIRALPNVRAVRGRVRVDTLVYLDDRYRPTPGVALSLPPDRNPTIDDVLLVSGAFFSGSEAREVILDAQFAEAHDLVPGDRIKTLLLDKQHDLLVVGTAMSPEFVYLIGPGGGVAPDPAGYAVMYFPRRFLQQSGDLEGAYNELVGTAFDASKITLEDTLDLIKDKLDSYGVTNAVQARDQPSVSVLRDELTNLKATATIFPIIFLGVAALVLNIMIARLTAQQRTAIGTLRALGYSRWAVTRHYMAYGVILGLVGGVFGIALGLLLQGQLIEIYKSFFAMPGIQAHWYPEIPAIGLVIAIGFGAVGAVRSSRKAARLEPAEAMRPPPPEKGGRIVLERIPIFWSSLNFRSKMVFRSVFRNPFRSAVSIFASMTATALLLATLCLYDGLYYMMDYHFTKIAHQDITVTTRNPVGIDAIGELAALGSVSKAEPQLSVVSDLQNGPREKRTAITGLPPRHPLYTPLDAEGRPIEIPDNGVVLSRSLAHILGARVGDEISIRPLIAERRRTSAPVLGIIDTFLGLSAYCDIGYLSRLLGEEETVDSILLTTFGVENRDRLMKEIRRRPKIIGVTLRERALKQMKETMGKFLGSFLGVTIVFAGVIAFGSVINTALVSLSERRRDVGTLRVVGYTSGQAAKIFSGESFLLNIVGILAGLALGVQLTVWLSKAFQTELYRVPVVLFPSRFAISAAIMVGFVTVAQIIIYRMIRGLAWLEALSVKE